MLVIVYVLVSIRRTTSSSTLSDMTIVYWIPLDSLQQSSYFPKQFLKSTNILTAQTIYYFPDHHYPLRFCFRRSVHLTMYTSSLRKDIGFIHPDWHWQVRLTERRLSPFLSLPFAFNCCSFSECKELFTYILYWQTIQIK